MQNKVTELQIIPIKPRDGLVGFASFTFDDSFHFSSIGIYTRPQGGYRLTYPTRNNLHVFHPINKEISRMIEASVSSKYEEIIAHRI